VTDTTVDINNLTQTHGPGVAQAQKAWQELVKTVQQGDAPIDVVKQKVENFKTAV
jgi:hypothetical protein